MSRISATQNQPNPTEIRDRRRALGAETRQRILDAAERLFAARSYETVSMRDITREAGANTAAIYYHFGSKEDLLLELLRARAFPIARNRIEMLNELRHRGPLILEDVIHAFLAPAFFENPGGDLRHSPFAELRARLAFHNEPNVRRILSEIFNESSKLFIEAFSECLPNLPRAVVYHRFHFLLGAMFYTMSNTGRVQELSGGISNTSDPNEVMRQAIPFLTAGFSAPATR